MPAPSSSTSAPGSASAPGSTGSGNRRHFRYSNPDVRVSDAERSEIGDILAKHYAEGRLDQAEFNERVERAMKAKTRADFRGLLDDLPDLSDTPGTGAPVSVRYQRPRYPLHRILFLGFVIAATVIVAHALMHSVVLWLMVGLVVFLVLRDGGRRRRRL